MISIKPSLKIMLLLSCLVLSCSTTKEDPVTDSNLPIGSGDLNYFYAPMSLEMRVFYYIPTNATATSPVVFTFHGASRNADEYRDAMITKAQQYGFIVIAPEFSEENFPTSSGYNLGNMYLNGNTPTPDTLLPEEEWTFRIIQPLFEFIKEEFDNTSAQFHAFGHSAGSQFLHRLLMFMPSTPIDKSVLSAAGWYTFPTSTIGFPYGLGNSPMENLNFSGFFSKEVRVQVGGEDDNPNAAGLRRNALADAQGITRKDRATSYFQYCEQLAEMENHQFNWDFYIIPNLGHDFSGASKAAADYLFQN